MNMKRFLVVVIVATAAFLGWVSFPGLHLTDEEKSVLELEKRFISAKTEYEQAGRMAGTTGIDSTAQADAARRIVAQIERELRSLALSLDSDSAKERAEGLATAVQKFLNG